MILAAFSLIAVLTLALVASIVLIVRDLAAEQSAALHADEIPPPLAA
ncbi:MAG: hypothetical protein R2707_13780 [Acidimicrobiales bacterium]